MTSTSISNMCAIANSLFLIYCLELSLNIARAHPETRSQVKGNKVTSERKQNFGFYPKVDRKTPLFSNLLMLFIDGLSVST